MTPETCESLISFFGPNMIIINIGACHVRRLSLRCPEEGRTVPSAKAQVFLLLVFLWRSVQDLRLCRLEFDSAGSPASC